MYLKKIPRDKKIPKIKAQRFSQQGTAAHDASIAYSYNTILTALGLHTSQIIAVYIESVRPLYAWSQVLPYTYYVYSDGVGSWGFYNAGTGGEYQIDIIVIYDENK